MNTKKPIYSLIVISLVLSATTLVGAYISPLGIHLPATPVILKAVDGTKSYFNITLSNVPVNNDVSNGTYLGWCADRSVTMPRNTNLAVTLYDSYNASRIPIKFQDPDWDRVNWILNHKGSYTRMDIQWAIWHLLNEYSFNALSANIKVLVNASKAGDGFTPSAGEILAIIAVPIRTDAQCAFIELKLPSEEYEGKSHGYWKNHFPWPVPYTKNTKISDIFTLPSYCNSLKSDTLLAALKYNGGDTNLGAARILLRNAVGALLNAAHPNINYPLSPSKLIHDVNHALISNKRATILNLEQILNDYNNLGADLLH